MGNGISVGSDVTPEFNERIEDLMEERQDNSKSETVRHLLRAGMDEVGHRPTFAQTLFKHLAIGFAMVAIVGYLWAALIAGYDQPLYVGVVWMVPAVAALWLHELWPAIWARLSSTSGDSINPSES